MERRLLGHSGLSVPLFSFGTMTFGGQAGYGAIGSTAGASADEQVGTCIDAGVDLFDTADIYSGGASEEILGKALGTRRKDVLIATKVFGPSSARPEDWGLSRSRIVRCCEASLKRLGTDWIDLYQVHNFDGLVPLDETLSALDDLVRAGKVRYIGCSNHSGWHLAKAQEVSRRDGLERYVSQQIQYSLVTRDAELELLPAGHDYGIGSLVWSPLAQGILTGKGRAGSLEGTRIGNKRSVSYRKGPTEEILDVVLEIAEQRGVSASQVALNWLVARPGVSTVIIGARTTEQLRDNLAAATWSLEPEEMERLTRVSAVALPYPYSLQRILGAQRNPNPYW